MKNIRSILALTAVVGMTFLSGLISTPAYGFWGDGYGCGSGCWDLTGYSRLTVENDSFNKARIKDDSEFDGDHLRYVQTDVSLNTYIDVGCECTDQLLFGADWNNTYLGWSDNPFYDHQHFNTLGFNVGYRTQAWCDWTVQALIGLDSQTHRKWGDSHHTIYNASLWGRYSYCDYGVYVGAIGWTGIKKTWWLPILGVDFSYGCWDFNLIFPDNLAIIYNLNDSWSLSLEGELFYSRFRLRDSDEESRGIVQYRNEGIELGLNYHYCEYIFANFHVGRSFEGRFKIEDRDGDDSVHLKLKSVYYFGGGLNLVF